MLVFSWVKETAEVVRYEALYLVHPLSTILTNTSQKLGLGNRPGHYACSYAIGSALVSLALEKNM